MRAEEFHKLAEQFGDRWERFVTAPGMKEAFQGYVDAGIDPGAIRENYLERHPQHRTQQERREYEQRQREQNSREPAPGADTTTQARSLYNDFRELSRLEEQIQTQGAYASADDRRQLQTLRESIDTQLGGLSNGAQSEMVSLVSEAISKTDERGIDSRGLAALKRLQDTLAA
jgi:hypothetical protein